MVRVSDDQHTLRRSLRRIIILIMSIVGVLAIACGLQELRDVTMLSSDVSGSTAVTFRCPFGLGTPRVVLGFPQSETRAAIRGHLRVSSGNEILCDRDFSSDSMAGSYTGIDQHGLVSLALFPELPNRPNHPDDTKLKWGREHTVCVRVDESNVGACSVWLSHSRFWWRDLKLVQKGISPHITTALMSRPASTSATK